MLYKALSFIISFLALNVCFAQSQITSKHIKVLSATENGWSPGMVQQNSEQAGGKIFEVQIKIRKRGNYSLEKFFVANESLDVELVKEGKRNLKNIFFKKCSKWQIIARSNYKERKDIDDPSIKKLLTENKEVAGWIQYKFKGQTFTRPINVFESGSGTPNQ